jgi:hypothetical protein
MSDKTPQNKQPDPIFAVLIGAITGGLGTGGYHILSGIRNSRVDPVTGTVELDLALGTSLGVTIVGAVLVAKHWVGRRR